MKDRVVSATDFKARCLALLDEISEHGGTITVTKPGASRGTGGTGNWKALEIAEKRMVL
jgi:hypothetical protein